MTDSLLDQVPDEGGLAHPKPTRRPRAQPKRIAAKGQSESSKREDLADGLFYKLLLRRAGGKCEALALGVYDEDGEPVRCCGRLDPAHGFSRRFHGTRYAHANVWLLCRAHHDHFQVRAGLWFRWRVLQLGGVLMEAVQRLARETWRGDIEEVIAGLREGRTQLEREG